MSGGREALRRRPEEEEAGGGGRTKATFRPATD